MRKDVEEKSEKTNKRGDDGTRGEHKRGDLLAVVRVGFSFLSAVEEP